MAKIHIPFSKYDVHISKRGINWLKNGQLVGFTDWLEGGRYYQTTPIMEAIYRTIASEFAKIDLKHVIDKNGFYKEVDSSLNYLISERPNAFQTKFDFLYVMCYQLWKYGNALAFIERDKQGNVISINPVNVGDFLFGQGYLIDNSSIILKYKNIVENMIYLVDYQNVIHIRANPNNIFYGDLCDLDWNKAYIDLIDASLNSLINELRENGTVRGIIQIGGAATGYARGVATRVLSGQEEKVSKQKEIIDRIKATKGGILVLDAGEEWKSLGNPFETTSTKDLNKYIDLLFQFNGINSKVIDGTATYEQMEVFFFKVCAPIVEQMVSEMNYKIFSKSQITRGNRIDYYRNPFEYVPTTVAIDCAYKGAMDTTVNERRRMIYKLPPIEEGDLLMYNKNFAEVGDNYNKGVFNDAGRPKKTTDEQGNDLSTITTTETEEVTTNE